MKAESTAVSSTRERRLLRRPSLELFGNTTMPLLPGDDGSDVVVEAVGALSSARSSRVGNTVPEPVQRPVARSIQLRSVHRQRPWDSSYNSRYGKTS